MLGKLRTLSGEEMCGILFRNGFVEVRRKGSHMIMQKKIPGSTVTVPVPNHAELKIGTLLSIIRQSSLPRILFES